MVTNTLYFVVADDTYVHDVNLNVQFTYNGCSQDRLTGTARE